MDLTRFEGKKILITGASGLIGRALVSALLLHNGAKPINVIALVRNKQKAEKAFKDLPQKHLSYLVCDVCELQAENLGVDYIIHGANQTASKAFVNEPVDVITGAIKGTEKVLEFVRVNPLKGFVYLSTMEVYGAPATDDKICEDSPSDINPMATRSSYPESKRLCECLCTAYASQYKVPAKDVRLTQTFGEGVEYNDGRLFAELARCVIEGRDIVLKTKGETKRNYLYTHDAVNAILTVLLDGETGQAYNAANEETYCSVYEMACIVAQNFGKGKVKVRIEEVGDVTKFGYAPTLKMNLSTEKLQSLGWRPETNLVQSFEKMIDYMQNHNG